MKQLGICLLLLAVCGCTMQPLQKELPVAEKDTGGITTLSFTNTGDAAPGLRVSITPQSDKYAVSWRQDKDTVWLCGVSDGEFSGENYPFVCSAVSDDGHTGTFSIVQTGSYTATSIPANADYVACAFNTPVYSNGTTTSPCGPRLVLPSAESQFLELNYGNSQIASMQLVLSGNGATPANQYEDAYMHVSGKFNPSLNTNVTMNPVMGMLEYRAYPVDDAMKQYAIYGYNTSANANNATNPGIKMIALLDDDSPNDIFASIARFNADGELDENASEWTSQMPLCVMCYNSNANTFCALQNRTEADPAVLRTVVLQKPSFINNPVGYYALRTGLSTFGTSSANLTNWATVFKKTNTPALLTFPPGTVRPVTLPLSSADQFVNPPTIQEPQGETPVTAYTEENFGGTSALLEVYKYYGAADQTLNPVPIPIGTNKLASFKLKQGYQLTLTENADGTGYGRIWGAIDQDVEVASLPAKLAGKVAFIRVLPWQSPNKKGVSRGSQVYSMKYMELVQLNWYYNWSRQRSKQLNTSIDLNLPFVPMAWGSDACTGAASYRQIVDIKGCNCLLGFNEPDLDGQSNLTVDQAIALWPKLLATGMRLGAPVPTQGQWNIWLKDFMAKAKALNYRVDFICLHWYDNTDWSANQNKTFTDAQAAASAQRLKQYLQGVYDTYGLPLWLTEFNCNRNRDMTSQSLFYPKANDAMEELPFLERHAYMLPVKVSNHPYSNGDFLLPQMPYALSPMGEAVNNSVSTRDIKTPVYESSGNLDK